VTSIAQPYSTSRSLSVTWRRKHMGVDAKIARSIRKLTAEIATDVRSLRGAADTLDSSARLRQLKAAQ
jgi:hypothetical protein